MGKKGKKGGSADKKAKTPDGRPSTGQQIEYLEVKISDLTDRYNRYKAKCELFQRENEIFGKSQARFTDDKEDIVEFLNLKVGEHEKLISALEAKIKRLEDENKVLESKAQIEIDSITKNTTEEISSLSTQTTKYKAELLELTKFAENKVEIEKKLELYEEQLKKKDMDHRAHIHNLERRMLQDKNQVKKEMLVKVNEAVANFRRVADQQMAETTKRALRENVAITSQLKKMSAKTMEITQENKLLAQKVAKLTSVNTLLSQSEQELAKRNQSHQAVVKMLVEKLRESDKMLEFAIETMPNENGDENASVRASQTAQKEYLDELSQENDALRAENEDMSNKLADIAEVTADINFTVQDYVTGKMNEKMQLEIRATLIEMVHKVGSMTGYDVDMRNPMGESIASFDDHIYSKESFLEDDGKETKLEATEQQREEEGEEEQTVSRAASPKNARQQETQTPENTARKQNQNGTTQCVPLNPSKAVQTAPLPFGPPVTSKFLLGEVRPWGPPSKTLPKKGLGMYLASQPGSIRAQQQQQDQQQTASKVPALPRLGGTRSVMASPVPPLSVG